MYGFMPLTMYIALSIYVLPPIVINAYLYMFWPLITPLCYILVMLVFFDSETGELK